MNKAFIDLILEKKPELKEFREKLEAMEKGSFCIHNSWGFGQIIDYDEINNRLIINFDDGKQGHAMDPVFCINKLEILPENHILVRAKADPAKFENALKKAPVDLVIEFLSQQQNGTATEKEIETIFKYIVPAEQFKKWWPETKKSLLKDSRIGVHKKKTDGYFLREEPVAKEQEVLETFYLSRQPLKKILLAEKLLQACTKTPQELPGLSQVLEELTTIIRDAKLKAHERLHGCWVRDGFAKYLDVNPETLEPNIKTLIAGTENLPKLIEDIPPAYYRNFLELLTLVYPNEQEWQFACLNILRNSSGKLTSECIQFLISKKCEALLLQSLQKWIYEKTAKAPVLLWIVKNRHMRQLKSIIEPLLTSHLLGTIFIAIDQEVFNISGSRRIPLADYLSSDKELIKDLLSGAQVEEIKDLARILLLNQAFDPLTKRYLLTHFLQFDSTIQQLIVSENEMQKEQLVVSQESFNIRKKEFEVLINQKIPENKKAIETARELGDLRENAEYKAARQHQESLLNRKMQLEAELRCAQITDFKNASDDSVGIGSVVELSDPNHKTQTYTILGCWDGNPEKHILSYKAPLGKALLNKGVGDVVNMRIGTSEKVYTVTKISRFQA